MSLSSRLSELGQERKITTRCFRAIFLSMDPKLLNAMKYHSLMGIRNKDKGDHIRNMSDHHRVSLNSENYPFLCDHVRKRIRNVGYSLPELFSGCAANKGMVYNNIIIGFCWKSTYYFVIDMSHHQLSHVGTNYAGIYHPRNHSFFVLEVTL